MVLKCVIGRDSLFDEKSKEELKHIKDIIEGIENFDIQQLKKVSDYIHFHMENDDIKVDEGRRYEDLLRLTRKARARLQ